MKWLDGIGAAGMAATVALTGLAPAISAPLVTRNIPTAQTEVVQIQDGYKWKRKSSNSGNNDMRRNGNWDGRDDSSWNKGNNNSGWYKGHRGYRYKRPGYRYHDGFWFPAGAFVAGAIIGGAIANQNVNGGNAHVEWCYDRYRSYRASDNTFQPNNGPRQQCRGPY